MVEDGALPDRIRKETEELNEYLRIWVMVKEIEGNMKGGDIIEAFAAFGNLKNTRKYDIVRKTIIEV